MCRKAGAGDIRRGGPQGAILSGLTALPEASIRTHKRYLHDREGFNTTWSRKVFVIMGSQQICSRASTSAQPCRPIRGPSLSAAAGDVVSAQRSRPGGSASCSDDLEGTA